MIINATKIISKGISAGLTGTHISKKKQKMKFDNGKTKT
jgi:hypothetical protein